MTNPKGHLFPDFGMDETRSRSWKTRLLDPAAFIATVYNPDNPDIELQLQVKLVATSQSNWT